MRNRIANLLDAIERDENGGGLLSRGTLRAASELRQALTMIDRWMKPSEGAQTFDELVVRDLETRRHRSGMNTPYSVEDAILDWNAMEALLQLRSVRDDYYNRIQQLKEPAHD